MNTLVVYDSQYGNTERVAQAIADALRAVGQVLAIRVDPAHPIELQGVDMLIVGCPTQGWRPTAPLQSFLENVSSERLRGVRVACFDTRFRLPGWITGSAARVMARKLQQRGIPQVAPPESFFVKGGQGPLHSGELERAASWAQVLVKAVEAPQPVV
jgi:flavodoxin